MSKAAEAFRTISEVAADLDVPKHVLRFWEAKFPQIRPMKRGGGRRYYRPEDLELLRGIRRLLHAEGYTIKGVQKILREQGVDHVKAYATAPATVDKPKARARGKADGATARHATAAPSASVPTVSAPALSQPAPVNARKPARGAETKTIDGIIRAALVELEACRRLLLSGTEAVATAAAPVAARVRAGRG
jgi:DNA-binding transcriptional MerR regulator